jgi:hypothetical protein
MSSALLEMPSPNSPPPDEPVKFGRGQNPASRENLTSHKGRPSVREMWGEDAEKLTTSCTPTAKQGIPDALKASGYLSLPDLLEYIGRGLITLPQRPPRPEL